MKPGELGIEQEERDGRHVIHLSGELDLSFADELERTITMTCLEGATSIELEVGSLSFVDSAGLRAMLAGRQVCERGGCELFLTKCGDRVRRVLELTGMEAMLDVRSADAEGAEAPTGDPGDVTSAD